MQKHFPTHICHIYINPSERSCICVKRYQLGLFLRFFLLNFEAALTAWSGHEQLFLPREREMGKKRFSGWDLQSEHNFLGGFGGMPPQANFEIFNAKSCILSISERVLMFENKYIILLCFVVYNQFQIWIWIKLHCLLYFPIVYLMFNNLSIFFSSSSLFIIDTLIFIAHWPSTTFSGILFSLCNTGKFIL